MKFHVFFTADVLSVSHWRMSQSSFFCYYSIFHISCWFQKEIIVSSCTDSKTTAMLPYKEISCPYFFLSFECYSHFSLLFPSLIRLLVNGKLPHRRTRYVSLGRCFKRIFTIPSTTHGQSSVSKHSSFPS